MDRQSRSQKASGGITPAVDVQSISQVDRRFEALTPLRISTDLPGNPRLHGPPQHWPCQLDWDSRPSMSVTILSMLVSLRTPDSNMERKAWLRPVSSAMSS